MGIPRVKHPRLRILLIMIAGASLLVVLTVFPSIGAAISTMVAVATAVHQLKRSIPSDQDEIASTDSATPKE
jgi:hypothetical protein